MSIVDSSTADTADSTGPTMTSNSTGNTKGAWTEAIASTSEETFWITLQLEADINDENYLVDIGVGAAASEVVQIANIAFFGNSPQGNHVISISMPLTIASGARVSVRCQASGSSSTLDFMVFLSNDDSFGTSTSNITLGADTSTSKGTDVDPGGTDNTKGAYAELESSTSIEVNYIIVLKANSDNNAQTTQDYLLDIATGSASSEVDDIGNLLFVSNSNELSSQTDSFFHTISSGTRVSARCQSSAAVAAGTNDRLIDVAILGFNITPPAGGGGGIATIVGNGGIVGGH